MRQRPPNEFIATSFRNVPISRVKTRKKYPAGTRAIVGKLKKAVKGLKGRMRHYATQSILVPKKKRSRK